MKTPIFFCAAGALALGLAVATPRTLHSALAAADQPTPGIAVGAKVAPFSLPNTDGKPVEVGNWDKSKASVIWFVSTQCPISNAYNGRMENLVKTYSAKGVAFYGINSNSTEDNAEIAEHSRKNGFSFAVLKDGGNKIADRFNARVTPEVFVVAPDGKLVYHGQIDNSRKEEKVVTRPLAEALDAILAGKAIENAETMAFGCTIKREK